MKCLGNRASESEASDRQDDFGKGHGWVRRYLA